MRPFNTVKITLVVFTIFFMCVAYAQQSMTINNGAAKGGFYALLDSDVQRDLSLSKSQLDKLAVVNKELNQNMSMSLGAYLNRDTSEADRKKLATAIQKNTDTADSKSLKILNNTQKKRFLQLELQLMDGQALVRPKIQKTLGLSSRQKSSISRIVGDSAEGTDPDNRSVKTIQEMNEIQKEQNRKLLAVLTTSNKKKFKEMKGKTLVRAKKNRN